MKKRDYSTTLIFAALIVTVVRYMGAFVASDVGRIGGFWSEVLTGFMAVSGIGMGILDVLGMAYVFDGWRNALPNGNRRAGWKFVILTVLVLMMFFCGVAILTPFTVSRVKGESMAEVLGNLDLTLWAVAVNISPYLLVGGVVIAQRGVVIVRQDAIDGQTSRQMSTYDANHYLTDGRPSTNDGQMPTFKRGYDGFVAYLSWLDLHGRTFDKTMAAQEMNKSVRQIERYLEEYEESKKN